MPIRVHDDAYADWARDSRLGGGGPLGVVRVDIA